MGVNRDYMWGFIGTAQGLFREELYGEYLGTIYIYRGVLYRMHGKPH